jgi:hypothetical protein
MHNSRLGCFTTTGILAALITLGVIVWMAFSQGGVLYSPGELNAQSDETIGGVTSHAQIGGDCKTCHVAPWSGETMADRCLACHADVSAQMREVASLHGGINQSNPTLKCIQCHPDHRGPDAPLTDTTLADFPHEALGFSLTGHALTVTREAFLCSDCHTQGVATFALQDCTSCHQQIDAGFMQTHAGQYGAECLACHDGVDRFGKKFTHNFDFKLIGEHAQINCAECHVNVRAAADFDTAPADCFSCHAQDDPHKSRFGSDCALCHASEAWTPAQFDHNLSAFKLDGEHAEASCEDCHQNDVFAGTPSDCYSCHAKDDDHDGRFGTKCEGCHNPSDWENARVDHALLGNDCYSCHARDDEHNGNFGTDCAACHTTSDWDDANFDHSRGAFPLTGAHERVECELCHLNNQFVGTPTQCVSCHADPVFHLGLFSADCASCHSTQAWRPAQYNQPHTFPLNHGENGVSSCVTCHPSAFTAYTCYGCHEHNEANVRSEHLEEGISDFQNCMECHPTGDEHEGGGD